MNLTFPEQAQEPLLTAGSALTGVLPLAVPHTLVPAQAAILLRTTLHGAQGKSGLWTLPTRTGAVCAAEKTLPLTLVPSDSCRGNGVC